MFRKEEYGPYMIGVFILGGLIAVPLIWSYFVDLPYEKLVLGSLLGCGIFAFAHTRDGDFSLLRFFGAFAFVFLMSLKISVQAGGTGPFVPGGLLGFFVMAACGHAGVGISRLLSPERPTEADEEREDLPGGPPVPADADNYDAALQLYMEENEALPERVYCPLCDRELELDKQERKNLRFQCPECQETALPEHFVIKPTMNLS